MAAPPPAPPGNPGPAKRSRRTTRAGRRRYFERRPSFFYTSRARGGGAAGDTRHLDPERIERCGRPGNSRRALRNKKTWTSGELIFLVWNDLVGLSRTRGMPVGEYERRKAHGLGWALAGQAMTPFEDIAENPWGPMDEVRQIPDDATRRRIELRPEYPPLHLVPVRQPQPRRQPVGVLHAKLPGGSTGGLEGGNGPRPADRLRERVRAVWRGHALGGAVLAGCRAPDCAVRRSLCGGPDRRRARPRDLRA